MDYLFPEHISGMDRRAVAKKSNKWRKKKNVGNNTQQVKELVYFSDDTILEAVKFLNYERWSEMRFLCHRVNQLIQNNQSKLQAFEVQSLSMENIAFRRNSIVSFDQGFKSTDAVRKWFQDRGYSFDETTNMPLEKVFAGMKLFDPIHFTIRAFFEKLREKNMPLPQRQAKRTGKTRKKQMRKKNRLPNAVAVHSKPPQVFSAKFSAQYEFYKPILSHFFRLLHHPTAYFREVSMFPPMTDKFCDMSHSPIRCDQFTLKNLDFRSPFAGLLTLQLASSSETSDSSLEDSLKWLKNNVRAHQIILSFHFYHAMPTSDLHSLVSEFLLMDSSICARDHIKLDDSIPQPEQFVNALFEKYETMEVTKTIPAILIEDCPSSNLDQYRESRLVAQDDSPVYDERCDRCYLKTYQLQNKFDGNRKMIAQFSRCFKQECLCYGSILHMRFE